MHIGFSVLIVFFVSLLVASLIHKPVLRFAQRHKIYDNPEDRKLQRRPIPVMGGFVVFLGAIVGSTSFWLTSDCSSIVPVQIAMLIMLGVGAYDDIKKLSPISKFIIETLIVTALVLINNYPVNNLNGLWGVYQFSPWIAWFLTVFGCVGIINAINMIDGIDGLSSGICIMVLFFFSWWFYFNEDYVHTALGVSILGGLIPFFVLNVFGNKSKMFIGDAGTMMLGIVICDMVLSMLTYDPGASTRSWANKLIEPDFSRIAFALAVLAIPIFDTIRVMLGRICRGESPFTPDKTHLHHAFIDYGFHHLETALMEILLNVIIVIILLMLYYSHLTIQWQLISVVGANTAATFGLYYMLGRRKRISKKVRERYGVSVIEFENLTNEERKALYEKNKKNEQ